MSHEFWCWRESNQHWGVSKSRQEPTGDRAGQTEGIDPVVLFEHQFGVLPAEGQALQIDPSAWAYHCPVCDQPLSDLDRCDAPSCNGNAHWHGMKIVYHARIVSVKNLEEGK